MQFQSEGSTRKIGQINEKISKTHSQPKTHQPEGSKRKTKVRLGKSRGFLKKNLLRERIDRRRWRRRQQMTRTTFHRSSASAAGRWWRSKRSLTSRPGLVNDDVQHDPLSAASDVAERPWTPSTFLFLIPFQRLLHYSDALLEQWSVDPRLWPKSTAGRLSQHPWTPSTFDLKFCSSDSFTSVVVCWNSANRGVCGPPDLG